MAMNPQAADVPQNRIVEVGPFLIYHVYDDLLVYYIPSSRYHQRERRAAPEVETAAAARPSAVVAIAGRFDGDVDEPDGNSIRINNDDNDGVDDNDDDVDPYADLPDLIDHNGNVVHYHSNPQGGEKSDSLVGKPCTW